MKKLSGLVLLAACGGSSAPAPESPAPPPPREHVDGEPETKVAPSLLEPNRIGGSKMIAPPDDVKASIPDGRKIASTFKFCISATGEITSVRLLRGSGFPNYDLRTAREIRDTWKYQPFTRDGQPIAVCSAVTFIYSQRG